MSKSKISSVSVKRVNRLIRKINTRLKKPLPNKVLADIEELRTIVAFKNGKPFLKDDFNSIRIACLNISASNIINYCDSLSAREIIQVFKLDSLLDVSIEIKLLRAH